MSYNGNWEITYEHSNQQHNPATEAPPVLGNGKIAIIPSFDGTESIDKCYITENIDLSKKGNAIQTFNTGRIILDDIDTTTQSIKLNMYNGMITHKLTNSDIDIDNDVYVHYQYPFSTINTKSITPLNDTIATVIMTHEVTSQFAETVYTNQLISNSDGSGSESVNIFCGEGVSSSGKKVYVANAYITENCQIEYLGYNVYSNDKNRGFNKVRINGLINGQNSKVHTISVHMTTDDFENPKYEVQNILLSMVNTGISKLRSAHSNAWARNWLSDIQLLSKEGIPLAEEENLEKIKMMTRLSLYHIYSLSREIISIDGAKNIGFIDIDGTLMSQSDLFIVPTLLLLKPSLAKSLIDYRYHTLKQAQHIAASYGFKGSKFPYEDDVLGYKNSLYWVSNNTQTVYNTGLVSISVWNYYRVTLDNMWLNDFGYPVLKNNANFITSIMSDECAIENIYSVGGQESKLNNSFTNNVLKYALKMAIEASYQLGYKVPNEWKSSLSKLVVPLNESTFIYKFDEDTDIKTAVNIMEPLFLYLPYYDNEYVDHRVYNNKQKYQTMDDNLSFYIPLMNSDYVSNSINLVLQNVLSFNYTQYDPTTVRRGNIETSLIDFISNKTSGVFNNFRTVNSIANIFDISVGSAFLFTILQGLVRMDIKGGISETNFYYEEMSIKHNNQAIMPEYWKQVRVIRDNQIFVTYNV